MNYTIKTHTKKAIKRLVEKGLAVDLTQCRMEGRTKVMEAEGYLTLIGIARGIYGVNAKVFRGAKSGKLYAVTDRTTAIHLF